MAGNPDALTAIDALVRLAPLIGGGGLAGIIIAVFGYLKAAKEGRPRGSLDMPAQVGIATLYAEAAAVQQLGAGIENLAAAANRLARTVDQHELERMVEKADRFIDELREIRRAVEDLKH